MASLRAKTYHKLFVGVGDSGRFSLINLSLVGVIIAAVAVSIIGTEPAAMRDYHGTIIGLEITFGVIFTVEYLARLWCIVEAGRPGSALSKRLRFIVSPLAIIDLIVIVTSLLPFFFADVAVLRLLRLLRIIALAKFTRLNHAIEEITLAVWGRRYELVVTISLAWVLLLLGAVALYWAERDVQPEAFGSVLRALWWGIITLTTVGYGDVYPITPLGKALASVVALCGVALVAMPAGIMAAAFTDSMQKKREAELAQKLAKKVEAKVDQEIDRLTMEERRKDDT